VVSFIADKHRKAGGRGCVASLCVAMVCDS